MLSKTTVEYESQPHRPNSDEFVKMVNVDMYKDTKQTRHNLLHTCYVIARKWHT